MVVSKSSIESFVLTLFPLNLAAGVDCGPLSPPVNGVVDQSRGTRFTDETLYTCLEGYVLTPSDSQIRICTETGQWSGSDPTCDCK